MQFQGRKPHSVYEIIQAEIGPVEQTRHLVEQEQLDACLNLRMLATVEEKFCSDQMHNANGSRATWISTLIDDACRFAFDHLSDFHRWMSLSESEKIARMNQPICRDNTQNVKEN